MSASLTLNKITAQKGISIAEAASRVADLGWTPSYVQEAMTFPTDYKISKTPRDPMKQVLRSYFPMQEEKGSRLRCAGWRCAATCSAMSEPGSNG